MKKILLAFSLASAYHGYAQTPIPDAALTRISAFVDVRQHIDPDGINFFTTPFMRGGIFNLQDSRDFVFACYDTHMEVFDKKKKFWRMYTVADGYSCMKYPAVIQSDYDGYFAVAGGDGVSQDDTGKVVNVFDKRSSTIFQLSTKDFPEWEKQRKKEDYVNPDETWWIRQDHPYEIIRESKKTGMQTRYSYYYTGDVNISGLMATDGKRLVAIAQAGFRKVHPHGKSDFVFKPIPMTTEIKYHDQRLLLVTDSTIQIRDDTSFNVIYSFPAVSDWPRHADFSDRYLFYSIYSKFYVVDLVSKKVIDSIRFASSVYGITCDSNAVFIQGEGFSVYNIGKKTVEHFLGNREKSEREVQDEGGEDFGPYQSFKWIGTSGDLYYGIQETEYYETMPMPKVFIYDKRAGTVVADTGNYFPPQLLQLENFPSVVISGDHAFLNHRTYPDQPKSGLYKFEENEGLKTIWDMEWQNDNNFPNVFQPEIDFPVGEQLYQQLFTGSTLWITTSRGLFSYNLTTGKWKSHFIPAPYLAGIGYMFATHEGVYCMQDGGNGGEQGFPLTRLDLQTFQLTHFDNTLWRGFKDSYKYRDQQVIWATSEGIRKYDFTTNKFSLMPSPDTLRQVAFMDNGYVAANRTHLYLYDVKGTLSAVHPFKRELIQEQAWSTPPSVMCADGDDIWLFSQHRFEELTRFNISTGQQNSYHYTGMEIRSIFADDKYVWMAGSKIFRFTKSNSTLYELGFNRILDAMDGDSVIYVLDVKGIYEINKSTLAIRKSKISLQPSEYKAMLTGNDSSFFLTLHDGILQLDADTLIKSFKKTYDIFYYRNYDKGILPDTRGNKFRMADTAVTYRIFFNLEEELKDRTGLTFEPHYPEGNLKVLIDTAEVKIACYVHVNAPPVVLEGGEMQSGGYNPALSWYVMEITPTMLASGSKEVSIYYVSEGTKKLLKTWSVVKE